MEATEVAKWYVSGFGIDFEVKSGTTYIMAAVYGPRNV